MNNWQHAFITIALIAGLAVGCTSDKKSAATNTAGDTAATTTDTVQSPSDTTGAEQSDTTVTIKPDGANQTVGSDTFIVPVSEVTPPKIALCQQLTFAGQGSKVSFLAVDETRGGLIPANKTASNKAGGYRNGLSLNDLVRNFIPSVNTALAAALAGFINGQRVSSGPLGVLIELKSDQIPLSSGAPDFSLSVFGGYIKGYTGGISAPKCDFEEHTVGNSKACDWNLDIISFVTVKEKCVPRFHMDSVKVGTNNGKDYIYGKQKFVQLVLPIGGKNPLLIDLFEVEIDAALENKRDDVTGIFLGHGALTGLIAGIVCTDQLGSLISSFQDLDSGTNINFTPILDAVADSVAKDEAFTLKDDPCAKDGRNAKGISAVLRFRTIPAGFGVVVETDYTD